MSSFLMLGLALATLLFWAVGAYNRLVRLRAEAIESFASVEQQLGLYVVLVQSGLAQQTEDALLGRGRLLDAAGQFAASLKVARRRPLDVPTMGTLISAHDALIDAWLHLCNGPHDLAGAPLPDALLLQWQHIAQQVEEARMEFNRRVQNYNQAIDLFPTRLLAGLFRLRHALAM